MKLSNFARKSISLSAGLVIMAAISMQTRAQDGQASHEEGFTVDVAESPVNYQQNNVDPSEGQDVFSPGDTFILEGTIYPAGTLPRGKANNDPEAPGGIGKYRVRGTFTADFANFEKAVNRLPGANPEAGFVT